MKFTRRGFIRGAGVGGAGAILSSLSIDAQAGLASAKKAVLEGGVVTTTICPFCAVGCGALVVAKDGRATHIAGDPDHPINEGALCSKGQAMLQIANNERRLTKIKYRAPGSGVWEERDWEWAVQRIAENIKASRDATFKEKDEQGRVVNRTEGIACMGGAALDNEECYAYSKLARGLGVVYLEHQARI